MQYMNNKHSANEPDSRLNSDRFFQAISGYLDAKTIQILETLINNQDMTCLEAIQKAIAVEAYLLDEKTKGSKILLYRKGKALREIVFGKQLFSQTKEHE